VVNIQLAFGGVAVFNTVPFQLQIAWRPAAARKIVPVPACGRPPNRGRRSGDTRRSAALCAAVKVWTRPAKDAVERIAMADEQRLAPALASLTNA